MDMTGHGKNPWADAVLKVRGKLVNPDAGIVLLRDEGNEISLEGVSDIIETVGLLLSDGGGLNVDANPAFEAWNPPEEKKFVWTVTPGAGKSGHIKLLLISREGEPISWEISCRVLSSNLSDEADVMIGGVPVSAQGNLFFRDIRQTVTLVSKAGSPLGDHPVGLKCVVRSNLNDRDVVSTPAFDSPQTVHSWAVTGSNNSGSFVLSLTGENMPTPITLPFSTLLSSDLAMEITVMLDGIAISPDGENFIGGVTRKISLYYKNGHVLRDIPLTLDVIPVAGVETSDFQSDPSLGDPSVAHQWDITPADKVGTFKYKIAIPAEEACLVSPVNRLESSVDFRFIDLLDQPLPFPPKPTPVYRNILYAAGVALKAKDGTPMVAIPVTFDIAEHGEFSAKTGDAGKAAAGLVRFTTVGKRELRAVASLPSGDFTVEAWIEVV
ncbi:hypothetical protein [Pseudomonas sp. TMB3-21]